MTRLATVRAFPSWRISCFFSFPGHSCSPGAVKKKLLRAEKTRFHQSAHLMPKCPAANNGTIFRYSDRFLNRAGLVYLCFHGLIGFDRGLFAPSTMRTRGWNEPASSSDSSQ